MERLREVGKVWSRFRSVAPQAAVQLAEKARLTFVARMSLLSAVLCFAYACMIALVAGLHYSLPSLVASTMSLLSFLIRRRCPTQLPDHLFLFGIFQGITFNAIIMGPSSDLHFYIVVLGFAPILILPEGARWSRAFWQILAIAAFVGVYEMRESAFVGSLVPREIPAWFIWQARLSFFLLSVTIIRTLTFLNWRRLAEIAKTTEILEKSQQIARMGSYEYDVKAEKGIWSDGLHYLHGIPMNVDPSEAIKSLSFVHPDDKESLARFLENPEQKAWPCTIEYRTLHADGKVLYIKAIIDVERDESGKVQRFYGACQDVTEQRETEQKIKASESAMVASAKLASLGEMAGGIAHEINNPLSILLGMARQLKIKVMRDGCDPTEVTGGLDRMEVTGLRIAHIIRGLKAFAREGGNDPKQPVSLDSILSETLDLCRERFQNHGVELQLKGDFAALYVECRPVQFSQVLINLLNNAFDAIQEDRQYKSWIRIEGRLSEDKSRVIVVVANSGPIIPKDIRHKIMEPFFTTKPIGRGTGLGLSISRGIMEEMSGSLALDEQAHCTSFILQVPCRA